MDTNWYGVAGLLGLGLSVPLYRKISHTRALNSLGLEGVAVIPRFWGLSGLRMSRAGWDGEVRFETAGMRGHLILSAALKKPTPSLSFEPGTPEGGSTKSEEILGTGDPEFDRKISVRGDREFAKKLLGSDMRERLMALDRLGGRVGSLGGGSLVIAGPLLTRSAELKEFLKSCEAVIDRTVACEG